MDNKTGEYEKAIKACIENGRRLLEDSESLRDFNRFPTAKALAMLAQEEFAKAYILSLIQEGAIPLCDEVLKATKDHHCKQLMAILMVYLFTPWDDVKSLLKRDERIKNNFADFRLPKTVADALNIFCHEKIHKWKSSTWVWEEAPRYDVEAKKVWKGQIEHAKQNAIYVSIGKNGKVTNVPQSNVDDVKKQIEYAEILQEVASGNDCFAFNEKEYVKSVMREIFDSMYKK